jgi:hypothetical protein
LLAHDSAAETDPMTQQPRPEAPGQGPYDRPERDADDPIGDDAYPGGGGMMPPTGDLDDPIPETGLPGEPQLEETLVPDEDVPT